MPCRFLEFRIHPSDSLKLTSFNIAAVRHGSAFALSKSPVIAACVVSFRAKPSPQFIFQIKKFGLMFGFHTQNVVACFFGSNFQQTLLVLDQVVPGSLRKRFLHIKFTKAPFDKFFLAQQWIFMRMLCDIKLLLFRMPTSLNYLSFLPIWFSLHCRIFFIFITCIILSEVVCAYVFLRIQHLRWLRARCKNA